MTNDDVEEPVPLRLQSLIIAVLISLIVWGYIYKSVITAH